MGKVKKILLTGSHAATPALSVVEEIRRRHLSWKIYWIGKKWASENKKTLSLEYRILPKKEVTFLPLESGKIQTKFTKHTIFALLKVPFGFFQSLILILKIKPNLVLSFGGASGALVSFWAWVLGIPVVIHEQTTAAGRANIKSAKFAKVVAISRESSRNFFPKSKVILTGNPLGKFVFEPVKNKKSEEVKTILFTGGSRGSKWINEAVIELIPKLSKKYKVIVQAGSEHLSSFQHLASSIQLYGQVSPKKMIELLSQSDIVVGRAGANTTSELVALKKPCILIPIPWSYANEQVQNAKWVESLGLARILPQDKLSPQSLEKEIKTLILDFPKIISKTSKIKSFDLRASEKIVDLLERYAEKKK